MGRRSARPRTPHLVPSVGLLFHYVADPRMVRTIDRSETSTSRPAEVLITIAARDRISLGPVLDPDDGFAIVLSGDGGGASAGRWSWRCSRCVGARPQRGRAKRSLRTSTIARTAGETWRALGYTANVWRSTRCSVRSGTSFFSTGRT